MSQQPFGFGQEVDSAETEVRFWLQFLEPGLPPGTFEIVLEGISVVQREKFRPLDKERFEIAARMLEMRHSGDHLLLGPIQFRLAPEPPSTGTITGRLDPKTGQPRVDAESPAEGVFQIHFEVETQAGTFVTGQQPAEPRNPLITEFYPESPYTHTIQQQILYLYRKGALTKPVARVAAGFHARRRPKHGRHADGAVRSCCPPPTWELEAHGHRGCWRACTQNQQGEQILFAASPLLKGLALAYVTVTNESQTPVEVFWDLPVNRALLPACESITLAVTDFVKLLCVAPAGGAAPPPEAHGFYVVSWCCPKFGHPAG
jgi:hypothetical protein